MSGAQLRVSAEGRREKGSTGQLIGRCELPVICGAVWVRSIMWDQSYTRPPAARFLGQGNPVGGGETHDAQELWLRRRPEIRSLNKAVTPDQPKQQKEKRHGTARDRYV
jgi:hypothetical protein